LDLTTHGKAIFCIEFIRFMAVELVAKSVDETPSLIWFRFLFAAATHLPKLK